MRQRRSRTSRIVTWTRPPSRVARDSPFRRASRPTTPFAALRSLPFADLGFARVDHHRALRQGMAETVYGPGKTAEQCAAIVAELLAQPGSSPVLLTRADDDQVAVALQANPGGAVTEVGDHAVVVWRPAPARPEHVVVVTAGTADLPVADECAATLRGARLPSAADLRCRRRRAAPGARRRRRVGHSRRRGRGGRHGGRAGQRRRRPDRGAGRRGAHERRLRRGARRRHRAARDAGVVRERASRWSASTTGSAPRARSCGSSDPCRRRGRHECLTAPLGRSVAWFHCFSGIAGDMAMGALVDAGADLDEVRDLCERLPIGGWAARGRVRHARRASVARRSTCTPRRQRSCAPPRTSPRSSRRRACPTAFANVRWRRSTCWREAEGHLHRRPPEQVHFHEVGGIDAIVDVVGTCAALEVLGDRLGRVERGGQRHRHGAHRARADAQPARRRSPSCCAARRPTAVDIAHELTTPTGAALLAALAEQWGPMPAMTIDAVGFGAGTAELDDRPNLTQVVVGVQAAGARRRPAGDRCSRSTSTTRPASSSPTRSARCSRRAPTTPGSRRSS